MRVSRHKARIIELTLDSGEKSTLHSLTTDSCCVAVLYKQAQDLTLEDKLDAGLL